jgi:hypothetical protein
MNVRIAVALYSLAVVVIPIGVASKFLLGLDDVTWIDPTLVLSVATMAVLLPRWGDFLGGDLRPLTIGAAILAAASLASAVSGFLLRPTPSLYNAIREPLRLWLNLCWLLLSAWFLRHRPQVVLRWSGLAVAFALCTGIYLDLVVIGAAPAPQLVISYARLYFLRQTIWFGYTPVPRMSGLYFEGPPFGLFMFSMLVVLCVLHRNGFRSKWNRRSIALATLGTILSLADQVLLGAFISLVVCLPTLGKKDAYGLRVLMLFVILGLGCFEAYSISAKQGTTVSEIGSNINGNSVGERSFHLRYGISLLQAHPSATFFGIGPGRYGEYVAETGNYPDTESMQTSEAEVLVEWGVAGLFVWLVLLAWVIRLSWTAHHMLGIGLLFGVVIADSFQANWKHEAVFLAIATLCSRSWTHPKSESDCGDLAAPGTLCDGSGATI